MKKFFTLIVSSLFSISLLAYDGSGLSISAYNTNMNFKVELDGRNVFMNGNQLTLNNLAEGYHNVRIYRVVKRNDYGYGSGSYDQIIYSTSVLLARMNHTDIIISRSGKVFVDSYRISEENDWYNSDAGNNNAYGGGWNSGYSNLISVPDFQSAKETIRQEWFETSRLTLAKTILDKNKFTTQQVKEMMYLFTFEKNRLELAKYAYRKTADKENYCQLNDALTFSSTKEELARFNP